MVSMRFSSQDLDRIIVLSLLSLELQMTCPCHPIEVVSTGVKSIHIHYSGRSIDTRV